MARRCLLFLFAFLWFPILIAQEHPPARRLPPLPIEEESFRPDRCAVYDFPAAPEEMTRRVQRILRANHLDSEKAAVFAVAYPEGTILFQHNPHAMMNPASVTKLFTASAVLEVLGPDRSFETRLVAGEGECPALYFVGGGDPGLEEEDLHTLAVAASRAGISCARTLFYDTSLFDAQTLPPEYEQRETDAHWRPHVGAVAIHQGAVVVRVIPGAYPGAAPAIKIAPDCGGIMVDSRALTANIPAQDKPLEVHVFERGGETVVFVTGEIALEKTDGEVFHRALPDPDQISAWCLLDRLVEQGVKVQTPGPKKGKAPEAARILGVVKSDPVLTDIRLMETFSRNFTAEQFVKLIGLGECSPLSFECGLSRLRKVLERFRLPEGCLTIKNGSGLFDANRVSAAQTVRLLVESANHGLWGHDYVRSLPVAGKTGTMKERALRTKKKVLAKTGTLDGISALAGYIERGRKRYTAFAIFFADPDKPAWKLKKIENAIVETLASWK